MQVSHDERSIFWEVVVSVILRKIFCVNMCPISNGFRHLARNIFLLFLSVRNHNSQMTLHTDSNVLDIGVLRWEGGKILRAKFKILRVKYRKPLGIGHMFTQTFFLRMTDIKTSQNIYFPPVTLCIELAYRMSPNFD
jgi:hypothetical protein